MTSVIIPDSVFTIHTRAFIRNRIVSLNLGNSVEEIRDYAFSGNQLTSLVIPTSVDDLGWGTFSLNQLKSVTIQGKTSPEDFTNYNYINGWASGYSDSNIVWAGSGS